MADKGQYVYATIAAAKETLSADAEPIFKFNNGYDGGSHACIQQEHAHLADGNAFAGSCLFAIKPKILELL